MIVPRTIRTRGRRRTALAATVLLLPLLAACRTAIVGPEAAEQRPSATATASVSTPSATPTPRPNSLLDANGLPVGAVGPLLLYRAVIEDTLSFGLGSPSPEVVVYDVGAGEELRRIWIGNPGRQPQASFIVGSYVVVNFGDTVWRYALNGTRAPLIEAPAGTVISALAVDQASGVAVIATQQRLGSPADWTWIDVASSSILRSVEGVAFDGPGDPLPRIIGTADQPALVRGATYTEQPGGYAILDTDGLARELAVAGFVVPSADGRFLAHGPGAVCDNIGGATIDITEVSSNRIVASYSDPSVSLIPWDWSPDGGELAFQARPLQPDGVCPNTQVAPAWLTLSIDGTVEAVASAVALRDRWYGERAVTFRCADQHDAGWFSRRDGLQRPSDCLEFDVEIWLGSAPIALEPTAAILGFIEVD